MGVLVLVCCCSPLVPFPPSVGRSRNLYRSAVLFSADTLLALYPFLTRSGSLHTTVLPLPLISFFLESLSFGLPSYLRQIKVVRVRFHLLLIACCTWWLYNSNSRVDCDCIRISGVSRGSHRISGVCRCSHCIFGVRPEFGTVTPAVS